MQQSDILSFTEKLIPVYRSPDFEFILSQITDGQPASAKLLIKMELNRLMAPCKKTIDLRSRVDTECREYEIDGFKHWLDDIALNDYQKGVKKFSGYTEGVWETVCKARTSQRDNTKTDQATNKASKSFQAEIIKLGYDLKRKENRLSLNSQVLITLNNQAIHAVTLDLSPSGAKFKVPAAFNYKSGQTFKTQFTELEKSLDIPGLNQPIEYRILAIDDSYENNAVKYLRALRITETTLIDNVIAESLASNIKKNRHDNQDKIIRARTRGYEHVYLKHTGHLPLFFSGNQLKLVLLTENNRPIWQYWHDERNQQSLGSLFNAERMGLLTQPGVKNCSNVLYSFKHEYQDKTLFFSMFMPEASAEQRKLFWHIGAKKDSWKAFRLSVFELSAEERAELANHSEELLEHSSQLTHCGILQEIADISSAQDYLLVAKPPLPGSELNPFRHSRHVIGQPLGVYFDACSRRKELRYIFRTPLQLQNQQQVLGEGLSVDLSKHGLNLILNAPVALKAGDTVNINFFDLKRYDEKLPLDSVPYQVVRISPEGRRLQLKIFETSATLKTIAFLNSLIEHNQEMFLPQKEQLPSPSLLEGLHDLLLDKMVCSPIFVDKPGANLRPRVIGVNFPLPAHLMLLAKLGQDGCFSLEPIFKNHTNTLLASPMRRIDGAEPQHHEIYIAVVKFADRIQSVESCLKSEFSSIKERIQFIRRARETGEFYALRISGSPVFEPMTTLLREDLNQLLLVSLNDAKALEKELSAIVGYCELTDITQEVITRLELTD
ncbi:PilZ domain-containing protein [Vibrio metschnikovii]|uniref:PilZ domain-containing protein n=1 Tax=Vibrio metschnikovii TaxID=28172 RepID=A0A9X0UH35_VIBME|nr:PilZ domain-containing protein [Vibrio metschnikovii]MBC5849574.1 PilZ domain-containing protein [Vibrio metschnikovii]